MTCTTLLTCLLALLLTGAVMADDPSPGKQVECSLAAAGGELGYLLFLPKNYQAQGDRWPLILFLHGAGERGEGDLELVKKHGPPKRADKDPDFQFIVVSPQCPKQKRWSDEVRQEQLVKLLEHLGDKYHVDPQRVYLTGLSMGGYGSWTLAAAQPQRFAAVAPICGGGRVEDAERLKTIPIWAFHGAKDRVVPLERSQEMVDAIKKVGGNAMLTIYPEAGHDSWTASYDNPKLYEWFQKHQSAASER